MFTQSRLYVVVPLANDAIDGPDGKYQEVGENFKKRMRTALREVWERNFGSNTKVLLALGAGTDTCHAHGPTLAEVCEQYVLEQYTGFPILVNRADKDVFGTLAEIRWVIERVNSLEPQTFIPHFVFVTQRRHLKRVRCMVRWFFPEIDACFVESGQTKEIPVLHEVFAYAKLVLAACGLEKIADSLRRRLRVSIDKG